MKIVIADDNNTDRLILKRIIHTYGDHEVFAAADGSEAVALFKDVKPDIVLLDALMPVMDGYKAAVEIRKAAGEELVPIIFLTSLTEASALARCLEVGDDFLTKPYNKIILEAKIKAFERMKHLHDQVRIQRNEIQAFSDHMIHEQEVAKRLFDNIAHSGNLEQKNIKYLLSPMSIFNGDILLVARTPSDLTHIMLGDFTGHGLPAAIGALPVADIFYGMTAKGFAIVDIISEINHRLSDILPTGVFCCATICEISYRDNSLTYWSGGIPHGYIVRPDQGIVNEIESRHLPLGVIEPETFSVETDILRFNEGDKLYLISDGLLESESPDGEMYGDGRIRGILNEQSNAEDTGFSGLLQAVQEFTQSEEQRDDYTLIEYELNESLDKSEFEDLKRRNQRKVPLAWAIEYNFHISSLRHFDPLPLVLQILNECPGLADHRGRVFTILAELYSNALDHGVLNLDSELKSTAQGFAEFYSTKKRLMDTLTEGNIAIRLSHQPTKNGGELIITVVDDGQGFDVDSIKTDKNEYSGRGLSLVNSLCSNISFANSGRQVDVLFEWDYS